MASQVPGMGFPSSPQSSLCEYLGLVSGTTTIAGTAVQGCFHDHTVPIPSANQGGFTVVWHLFLVVCLGNQASVKLSGGRSCIAQTVSGTGFGGNAVTLNLAQVVTLNGTPLLLTSASAVEAAASTGIVTVTTQA